MLTVRVLSLLSYCEDRTVATQALHVSPRQSLWSVTVLFWWFYSLVYNVQTFKNLCMFPVCCLRPVIWTYYLLTGKPLSAQTRLQRSS